MCKVKVTQFPPREGEQVARNAVLRENRKVRRPYLCLIMALYSLTGSGILNDGNTPDEIRKYLFIARTTEQAPLSPFFL